MPRFRLPHPRRPRTTLLVGVLLMTVGLTTFLAYEAWDAARSHRATAERALCDYANFAAWEYVVSIKENVASRLTWVFSPIATLEIREPRQPLPPPSVLATEHTKALQCQRDSARYYFRYDLRDRSFVTSGDRPAPAMRAWIMDTVVRHAHKEYGYDWSYAAIFGTVEGQQRAIVYQLKRDGTGKAAAAYGFEFCIAEFGTPSFHKVMHSYALLPPSLTRGVPNDSLFSVKVTDLHGHELYRSAVQYPPHFVGAHTLDYFGGLRAQVSLRGGLAQQLLIGGLPRSRLPLLLGVLALTAALATIGLLQLRREGELARLRADFIASVSHELRTPLAQVRMFAETLLLGRVRSEEERRRSLQIVDQEARRLTHLVENILQFSRAERRLLQLHPVCGELAPQVQEAIESFAPVARARRVTVRAELEPDVHAVVDPGALRQIILNLLDNAVKYGPPAQTVTVGLSRVGARSHPDGWARIWVDDEGPGIETKDRARVWEPFHRLERDVSSAVAGSGIGLAVVRELVERHDGRARVETAPGGGARFVIELPASPPLASRGAAAAAEQQAGNGADVLADSATTSTRMP
jgi:signal transduction histidine kinase